jgi:cation diffusion facilitator CzcD-associated flavoprotein CzcO
MRFYRAMQKPGVHLVTDAIDHVEPRGVVTADGPTAYRSVAVPSFPNLFMLVGPHPPIGSQSLVIIAENQADYAMWWINQIREGRVTAAAPT